MVIWLILQCTIFESEGTNVLTICLWNSNVGEPVIRSHEKVGRTRH